MSTKFFSKKWLVLPALAVMALGGCSDGDSGQSASAPAAKPASSAGSGTPRDDLNFVNFRDIRDLNPHLYGGEMYAQNLIYESLIRLTPEGIKPWLAEKWDISEDGRQYTFYLRRDVSFSDGYKFDAHAVVKNFDAIMSNKERHTWLDFVRLMDKYEAVDDYTFRISLNEPYFPILIDLGVIRPFRFLSPNCMKDGETKDGVVCTVGTGSYYLRENKIDQYAVFERNESYYGAKPAIKTLTVKVMPDNQARVMALENGELDLIFGPNMLDAPTVTSFKDRTGFEVLYSVPVATRMILMNSTDPVLEDVEVRRAVQHAVNRQAISEGIFEGVEAPADTVMARSVPYCDIDLKPYGYSIETARSLLESAGWKEVQGKKAREKDGRPLVIKLYYNSNSVTEKSISEFLQMELAKIGMQLDITGEEEQSYRDRQKAGDFGMVFNISWGTPYDPQAFMAGMKLPVYGDYIAQRNLPDKAQIDEHIAKALISSDLEERQSHFTYVLKSLHDQAIYLPLTYERNRAIFKKGLKGVAFDTSYYEVPIDRMSWGDK